MKKRILALTLGMIVLACCVLSGCEKQPGTQEDGTLSVYVVESDALYVNAVGDFQKQAGDGALKVTTFESYQAMFDVMNVELMAKGGPDVVLYNSRQGEVDAWKLAQSGMFLPLDSYMKELDPDIYPAALMDAGHIGNQQYFVPFSYNLIYGFTTEKLMEERGYSASDSIYDTILREANALANVPDKASNTLIINRLDPVNSFFDAAGITLFDKNTGDIVADKAEIETVCSFLKATVFDETWWKAHPPRSGIPSG